MVLARLFIVIFLSSCTTGRLEYITPQGERKITCEVEYTWEPSVDEYAVEYILSYCAKQAVKKGNTILDQSLLAKDLSIPTPPNGGRWTFELAKSQHRKDLLTDKEYGYIIANIDLGLDK